MCASSSDPSVIERKLNELAITCQCAHKNVLSQEMSKITDVYICGKMIPIRK